MLSLCWLCAGSGLALGWLWVGSGLALGGLDTVPACLFWWALPGRCRATLCRVLGGLLGEYRTITGLSLDYLPVLLV